MTIEPFELPRPDWYDSEGRIYKDALIENFNALEAIMIQLQSLDNIQVAITDYEDVSLPDVTLDDADNKIINLKSFVDILGLQYYPLEIETNGTKVLKLSYYDSEYKLRTIENISLALNNTNAFVVLNKATNTLSAVADPSSNSNYVLVGAYRSGIIDTVTSDGLCDINMLVPLSKMPMRLRSCHTSRSQSCAFYISDPKRYMCYGRHEKYGWKSGGQNAKSVDQGEPNFSDGYYGVAITNGDLNRRFY